MQARKLDVIVLMYVYPNKEQKDKFEREMITFSKNLDLLKKINDHFFNVSKFKLQIKE